MNKPIKPINNGMKEPSKIIKKYLTIELSNNGYGQINLSLVSKLWNKALKDAEDQGHRISDEPILVFDYSSMRIKYTVEYNNINYEAERLAFDTAMNAYQEELRAWKEKEENF